MSGFFQGALNWEFLKTKASTQTQQMQVFASPNRHRRLVLRLYRKQQIVRSGPDKRVELMGPLVLLLEAVKDQ